MSTLNHALGQNLPRRRAASLAQTLSWHLHQLASTLERIGRHRAAPELARVAQRVAITHPELAASLAAQAREWQAR